MSHLRSDDGPAPTRRPSWSRFLIGIGVIVLVGVGIAVPVIHASDWRNTDYTAAPSHRAQPLTVTANRVSPRWDDSGIAPTGNPVVADTVVTADEHGVSGRDPATGKVRWTYERSGTQLCRWAVQDTTVITVFANGGDCSDLVAFDASTGRRMWYLNADLHRDIRLVPGPVVFLTYTATDITAFYLNGGNQAWTYRRSGCSLSDAVSGDLGAFVIAHCGSSPATAIGLDAYNGKEKWQRVVPGEDPAILSATGAIAVTSREQDAITVSLFSDDGVMNGQLHPTGLTAAPPIAWAAGQVGPRVVTYVGGRVLVFDPVRLQITWTAAAQGPALIGAGTVIVPTPTGFIEYEPDGRRGSTIEATVPAGTSAVGRVRDEVVAVTPERTTAFA